MFPEAANYIPGLTIEPALDGEQLNAAIQSLLPHLSDIGVDGIIFQDQDGQERTVFRKGFPDNGRGVIRSLGDVFDLMQGVSPETALMAVYHGDRNIITSFMPVAGLVDLTQNQ